MELKLMVKSMDTVLSNDTMMLSAKALYYGFQIQKSPQN